MKKFNDMWEDAAANSVSGGGVELPADAVNKKRKKPMYDGRTKEGRKFVERMLAKRKSRMERQTVAASKQNLASITVKEETVAEAKPPKMKGLEAKGKITGLRGKGMKMYTATPIVIKGKLAWRVKDDIGGSFETVDTKKFAKMFG